MHSLIKVSLFILTLLVGTTSTAGIKEIWLPTAADGDVLFKIDEETKLPISASDERCEVIAAGLAIGVKNKKANLEWHYSLKFKTDIEVESVLIEDEKSKSLKVGINDEDPAISDGVWYGKEHFTELTEDVFDLMEKRDTWFLLQRITVRYADGVESKLHQMILISQKNRLDLIDSTLAKLKNK